MTIIESTTANRPSRLLFGSAGDCDGTDRVARGPGWRSRRFFLAGDGLGYSMHETTVDAGTRLEICYTIHRESVYCVSGEGTVEDVLSQRVVQVRPGTVWSAGISDAHVITADSLMTFVCVFTPALASGEAAHDE
jgi:L-ectoine synthase